MRLRIFSDVVSDAYVFNTLKSMPKKRNRLTVSFPGSYGLSVRLVQEVVTP